MTAPSTDTITVDQFVAAPPSRVWRTLTDPELHARWWAPGDIAAVVGHRFHLEMPVYGSIPCEVVEVIPEEKVRLHVQRLVDADLAAGPRRTRHAAAAGAQRLRLRPAA
jgi:uncharacterized protein YndB with AHSA1/START domain